MTQNHVKSINRILVCLLITLAVALGGLFILTLSESKAKADAGQTAVSDLFTVSGDSKMKTASVQQSAYGDTYTGLRVDSDDYTAAEGLTATMDASAAFKYSKTVINGAFKVPAKNDTTSETRVNFILDLPQMGSAGVKAHQLFSDVYNTNTQCLAVLGVIRLSDAVDESKFIDVYLYTHSPKTPAVGDPFKVYAVAVYWKTFQKANARNGNQFVTTFLNTANRFFAPHYGSIAPNYVMDTGAAWSAAEHKPTFSVKRDESGYIGLYMTDTKGVDKKIVPLNGTYDPNVANLGWGNNTSDKSGMPDGDQLFSSGNFKISFYESSSSVNNATYYNNGSYVEESIPTRLLVADGGGMMRYSPLMIGAVGTTVNGTFENTVFGTAGMENVATPAWYTNLQDMLNKKNAINYELGGIAQKGDNPDEIATSDGAVVLNDPVDAKTGWVFKGWYADAAYTTPVTSITADASVDAQTIYAKFVKTLKIDDLAYNEFYLLSETFTVLGAEYTDLTDGAKHQVEKIELLDAGGSVLKTITAETTDFTYGFTAEGNYVIRYTAIDGGEGEGNAKEYKIFIANKVFDQSKLFNLSAGSVNYGYVNTQRFATVLDSDGKPTGYSTDPVVGALIGGEGAYNLKINGYFSTEQETAIKFGNINGDRGAWNTNRLSLKIKITAKDGSGCFYVFLTEYGNGARDCMCLMYQPEGGAKKYVTNGYNNDTKAYELKECTSLQGTLAHRDYNSLGERDYGGGTKAGFNYMQTITLKKVDGVFGVYGTGAKTGYGGFGGWVEKCWAKFDGTLLPNISDVLGTDGYTIEFSSADGTDADANYAAVYRDLFIESITAGGAVVDFNSKFTSEDAPAWYTAYFSGKMQIGYELGEFALANAADNVTEISSTDTAVYTLSAPTVKTGYVFAGWYNTADFTGEPITTVSYAESDLTLYAKVVLAEYAINYSIDGETYNNDFNKYNINTEANLPIPVKAGYIFLGWRSESENNLFKISAGRTGELTLAAEFVKNNFVNIALTTSNGRYAFPVIEELPVGAALTYSLKKGETGIDVAGLTEYVFTEAGEYTLTATLVIDGVTQTFDSVITVTEPVGGKISGVNLTLTEDVTLNVYVTLDAGYTDAQVNFIYEGVTYTVTSSETVSSGLKFSFGGVVIPYMDKLIDIEVTAVNAAGERVVVAGKTGYSVKTYLVAILDKTAADLGLTEAKTSAIKTLAVDLLKLGKAAQKANGLAENMTDGLTVDQLALGTEFVSSPDAAATIPAATGTVKFISAKLWFNEKVAFGFAFTCADGEAANLTAKIKVKNGDTIVKQVAVSEFKSITVKDGSAYLINFDGVMATQFGYSVEVTLYNGEEAVTGTLVYSVNAYVKRTVDKETIDPEAAALAKAIYNYGVSAVAYKNA